MLDQEKVQETIQDLQECKDRILERHEGDNTFVLRVDSVFNQLINSLAGVTGRLVSDNKPGAFTPTPLKAVAGTQIVEKAGPVVFEPIQVDKAAELKKEILLIQESFPSRENGELLENLNEFQIRGVAKMVGLTDFEDAPLDGRLIQSIKDKIQANADEVAAKEAAKAELAKQGAGAKTADTKKAGK